MHTAALDSYFETQITTATPQRLRLMLIDGAIRFARLTLDQWREGAAEQALESLVRCRDIVGELLAGTRADESPLAGQVSSLYSYLFLGLTEAQRTRDAEQLASVIRVLEEERETWRQVCEQLGDRPAGAAPALGASEELAPAIVASPSAFTIDA
jgi:flagellar secretion chaperone FliS